MLVRLQFLFAVLTAMFLVSCAEYPYVGVDATPSPNTGVAFNTFRGKIYFGPDTTVSPDVAEAAGLLVIAPDAVPFFGQAPILLTTDQDGAVTVRTDHSAVTHAFSPTPSSISELFAEYPQCPMPDVPVTAKLPLIPALQATLQDSRRFSQ